MPDGSPGTAGTGRGMVSSAPTGATANVNGCEKIFTGDAGYVSVPTGTPVVIDFTAQYVIDSAQVTLADLGSNGFYRYKIEASADKLTWQTIVDKTSGEYRGFQNDKLNGVTARYIRITGTYASEGNELRIQKVSFYNPRFEGSYMGYAQCEFSPDASVVQPQFEINQATGAGDMVSRLAFGCGNGVGIIIQIRNQKYSPEYVYVLYSGRTYSWKSWRDNTGSSILGIQSLTDILGNALNYPDKYAAFPTFNTLVYVPGRGEVKDGKYDMNQVMMTKLYLGDHLEEYQQAGLADTTIEKPKYFTLVPGFEGNKQDYSYWGYVKAYKINYPEDVPGNNAATASA